ncbi:hypothetical protein I0E51_17125 [Pseudomonas lalucatii]|nr:hypothetical protein [Pseudomonas lalucatii]
MEMLSIIGSDRYLFSELGACLLDFQVSGMAPGTCVFALAFGDKALDTYLSALEAGAEAEDIYLVVLAAADAVRDTSASDLETFYVAQDIYPFASKSQLRLQNLSICS